MMSRTHLAFAVLLLFALLRFTDLIQGNELLAVSLLLLGSILPDIDNSKSIIGKRFRVVNWFFRHRGFFHSIFAMVTFTVVVQLLFQNPNMSIIFLIGYVSHLALDSLSVEGTTPFYPQKYRLRGPLKVGSFLETIIFLLLIALGVYLLL